MAIDLPITPALVAVYRQAIIDGDDSRMIALEKLTGATAFEIVEAGWTSNEEATFALHARAAEKVAKLRALRKP